MPDDPENPSPSQMILFQSEDMQTRIEVRLDGGTVWLTQAQMADLFQTTPQNITLHLKAIFEEGELSEEATCKDYLQVRREGSRDVSRKLRHYNLDAILAVGYRVRSLRGTQFRQWATLRLKEYLVKGFVMDDERLKNPGPNAPGYFEELLARIRDIRSSERVFWRKVLDIYATSADYDSRAETSQKFFATVQNKMHWAAHGRTAAEVIYARVDSTQPHMGLTHVRPGGIIRKQDVGIAKNYLQSDELEALNRIVTAYLEFAELQAHGRKLMHMVDWITKLDDFLRLSERDILDHAGRISHDAAQAKAEIEFAKYRTLKDAEPQHVDADFDAAVEKLKKLPKPKPSAGENPAPS